MSDDLKQNLRGSCYLAFEDGTNDYETAPEAADRIEELEKALANMQREYDKRGDRIKELEAKLAKAVKALDNYSCDCGDMCEPLNGTCGDTARTTLAAVSETHKLKGEQP